MAEHGIGAIDLVVVNLYPFAATVAKGAARDEIIENIDIGGPSMVRSAAKNHAFVAIVTDPADYAALIDALDASGGMTSLDLRKRLAAKAFAATAAYDATIASWFAFADQGAGLPATLPLPLRRAAELRYGENPHQQAALYLPAGPACRGIAQAEQVQGKALSYNNYNDADAALELVAEFRDGRADLRHRQACQSLRRRDRARRCSRPIRRPSPATRVSAFGGIVARQPRRSTAPTAEAIAGDLHRSRDRARRRRGGAGDLRREEESAAAADRRAARSRAARAGAEVDRRRHAGPVPRQWPDRTRATSRS